MAYSWLFFGEFKLLGLAAPRRAGAEYKQTIILSCGVDATASGMQNVVIKYLASNSSPLKEVT